MIIQRRQSPLLGGLKTRTPQNMDPGRDKRQTHLSLKAKTILNLLLLAALLTLSNMTSIDRFSASTVSAQSACPASATVYDTSQTISNLPTEWEGCITGSGVVVTVNSDRATTSKVYVYNGATANFTNFYRTTTLFLEVDDTSTANLDDARVTSLTGYVQPGATMTKRQGTTTCESIYVAGDGMYVHTGGNPTYTTIGLYNQGTTSYTAGNFRATEAEFASSNGDFTANLNSSQVTVPKATSNVNFTAASFPMNDNLSSYKFEDCSRTSEGTAVSRLFKPTSDESAACNDGIDNDWDGNIDAADSDCGSLPSSPSDTTLTKAFSPATFPENGTATLTFAIAENATNDGTDNTGIGFTDTLPAGVVVAGIPNITNSCDVPGTVTAAAGASSIVVSGVGELGTASCTISVDVTSATAGSYASGPANISATTGTETSAMTNQTLTVTSVTTSPTDADNDGVADDKDDCPSTPAGGVVDTNGCPFDTDLGLTKGASTTSLTPGGDAFNYILTVTNSGAETHNVILVDEIPANLTINSATLTNTTATGGACATDGQTVTCTWDIMPDTAEETVTINVSP